MAVKLKTIKVERSPQERETLTDLTVEPPRQFHELDPLLDFLIANPAAPALPVGVGGFLFGQAPENQARERGFSDLLLAKLQREDQASQNIRTRLRASVKSDIPTTEEIRQAKQKAIAELIPLELTGERQKVEKGEQAIRRENVLLPILEDLKRAEVESTEALAARRRAETAELLDLAAVAREKIAAEAELARARAAQAALETRVFDLATGGLDFFSKQVFARELTRVAAGERPFFAPVERRRRVITSF